MNKIQVKKELFDYLGPLLLKEHFKPDKGNDRFVRKTPFGFQAISYHLVQYANYIEVIFYAHVRFDSIEDTWHLVSMTNPKFQKTSTTFIISMTQLDGPTIKPFQVGDKTSSDHSFSDFMNHVFPKMTQQVFEKFTTVPSAEKFLNGENGEPNHLLNNDEKRWIKGIISAHLIGKDTTGLRDTYRNQMNGMADTIKQKFEELVKHLQL